MVWAGRRRVDMPPPPPPQTPKPASQYTRTDRPTRLCRASSRRCPVLLLFCPPATHTSSAISHVRAYVRTRVRTHPPTCAAPPRCRASAGTPGRRPSPTAPRGRPPAPAGVLHDTCVWLCCVGLVLVLGFGLGLCGWAVHQPLGWWWFNYWCVLGWFMGGGVERVGAGRKGCAGVRMWEGGRVGRCGGGEGDWNRSR